MIDRALHSPNFWLLLLMVALFAAAIILITRNSRS